jgi:hypothetical protein
MSSTSPLNPLTSRQENICTYGGTFGVLLTITCLIQHFIIANPQHWLFNVMAPCYLFCILSFLFLAFQKPVAIVFLSISGVLALLMEVVWIRDAAFSLVVLLLFVYLVIMIVVLFTEQIPARLKQKRLAEIEEEMKWAGKI